MPERWAGQRENPTVDSGLTPNDWSSMLSSAGFGEPTIFHEKSALTIVAQVREERSLVKQVTFLIRSEASPCVEPVKAAFQDRDRKSVV